MLASPLSRASASGFKRYVFGPISTATRSLGRLRGCLRDQRGSQITDNLGLIVIGIVAIVAVGGLISGLDTTIFNWVTKQLGLS